MSAPYYEDDFVTLYHGDCREVTAWLGADVLVTDPPYGIPGGRHSRRIAAADWDDLGTRDAALSLWSDTKPALVFGTWKSPRPVAAKQVLVWDKAGGGGFASHGTPWGNTHEEIYLLGLWPKPIPGGSAKNGGTPSISHSVVRYPVENPASAARPDHPTPKPIGLMETLLARCPLGSIADPFGGSGSTLVAAKHLGRRAIGVELEERYCEMAANRLAQDTLFGGVA